MENNGLVDNLPRVYVEIGGSTVDIDKKINKITKENSIFTFFVPKGTTIYADIKENGGSISFIINK